MSPIRAINIPFLLLLCTTASAGFQHYRAPLAGVQWQNTDGNNRCSLRHDIPHYGHAVFSKAAGRELEFRLQPMSPATPAYEFAHLRSQPPNWQPHRDAVDLGEVPMQRGATPLRLGEAQSRRLLAELDKGMYPTFSYRNRSAGGDRVDVALPGVNFRQALDAFNDCLSRLPVYAFGDYQESLLHFDFGKVSLGADGRRRLDALATYLAIDPTVKQVIIDGHTDDVGRLRDNQRLSEQRGLTIRDYLVAKGVSPSLFALRSYGERKPIYTNTTETGRARNRRVRITLAR